MLADKTHRRRGGSDRRPIGLASGRLAPVIALPGLEKARKDCLAEDLARS